MDIHLKPDVAFHLTSARLDPELGAVDPLDLQPALFARYRDLAALRYDFPLVLVPDVDPSACVRPLSAVVDDLLARLSSQDEGGARITRYVLRLEREIRALAIQGTAGTLSFLWERAVDRLASGRGVRAGAGLPDDLGAGLARARAALAIDGDVVDCDARLPGRLVAHVWRTIEAAKARHLEADLARLRRQIDDLLRTDFARSPAGRTPDRLRRSIGPGQQEAFDFDALAAVLATLAPAAALTPERRARLETLSAALAPGDVPGPVAGYVFTRAADAIDAWRERLPRATALIKAMAMAELEIAGEYDPARHDAFFSPEADAGDFASDPRDLARFPSWLVLLNVGDIDPAERAALLDALAAGLPVKVVAQIDDLLGASDINPGHADLGAPSRQLTTMAMGLESVFVAQVAASHLWKMREAIAAGLAADAPAVFSIFSGASDDADDFPPYLTAAAAMECRAFPAFVYDRTLRQGDAPTLDLGLNRQVDRDWPVDTLAFEGAAHERQQQDVAFTLADLAACDRRYSRHLAALPAAAAPAPGPLVPLVDALDAPGGAVPFILLVDRQSRLRRALVDERLVRETRRCRTLWRALRARAGSAPRDVPVEMDVQEATVRASEPGERRSTSAGAARAGSPTAAVEAEVAATSSAPGDAYIETMRCTSCDECRQINDKMFGYNENKQAFVKDVTAGTFAQLVEAAESCQVSIIHPGQPRDPNEPGLGELVARAAAFQ